MARFTRSIDGAEASRAGVLRKAEFWRTHGKGAMSERQRAVLNRYLNGFEGALTAKKCSPASPQRGVADLVEKGVLQRNPGGSKSTRYALI
jgi:Fic family protein